MKNIISILDKLKSKNFEDYYYSLTIDYKNIINNFENVKFNIDSIENIINSYGELKTFNLTIYNYDKYDEKRYEKYYYNVDLIFHTGGVVFNFTSPYLTNRELQTTIDDIFEIYQEHLTCSEKLYNLIKK